VSILNTVVRNHLRAYTGPLPLPKKEFKQRKISDYFSEELSALFILFKSFHSV
jgi:hypothetical protein